MLVHKLYHLKDVYTIKAEKNDICVKHGKIVEFMILMIQHYAKNIKITINTTTP